VSAELTPFHPLCRIATMVEDIRLTGPVLKVLGVLLSCVGREVSGSQIGRATKLSSGTLYPILMRLEQAGWAESHWESGNPRELGRPRKRFYQLTSSGAKTAKIACREIATAIGGLIWS
jgi:PadR family transcriptional regulator, regulatory protein PadR